MSRLPGFIGPSNRMRSINVDSERTVNLILELPGAGTPTVPGSLYGRPGLAPVVAAGAGPIRAMFPQDTLAWVVSGGYLFELFQGGTLTLRGSMVSDGNPATICSNGGADGSGGHQLFLTSGGHGYIYDLVSRAFTEITADGFPRPCVMGAFLDGYFIALKANSNQFNLSNLEDGLTWDALDVAEISQWPGNIAAIITSHQELWPFSATQVNPWYDSAATFPLQPVPGASIEHGILAPWSACRLDNTLFWLSQTPQGGAIVVRAEGYSPKIISTPAVTTALQRIPNLASAVGFTLQIDGHALYGIYAANAETTWMYDLSTDSWAEWATWDPQTDRFTPFNGRCHMWAFGKHLMGAIDSGWIYELSFDATTDILKVGA